MSAKAGIYSNKNFGFRPKSRPVVAFGVKFKIFNLFGGLGGRVPLGGVFLPARLCRATARSAVQKQSRSDCSEIGCPRSAGIYRRHLPDLTSETFLEPLLVTKEVRPGPEAVRPAADAVRPAPEAIPSPTLSQNFPHSPKNIPHL